MDFIKNLRRDKLRTFLSLLGVSIGVFSIVGVLTTVDSIKKSINDSFDSFGKDIVIIDKIPFSILEEGQNIDSYKDKWLQYMKRPNITYNDYKYLSSNAETIDGIAYEVSYSRNVHRGRYYIGNANITGVNGDWELTMLAKIAEGRPFTESELNSGEAICMIGDEVKTTLFPDTEEVLGRKIKIGNHTVTIIGIFEKEGDGMVSINPADQRVVIPIGMSRNIVNDRDVSPSIVVKPKKDIDEVLFNLEIETLLRSCRRLSPGQESNFAINPISYIIRQTDKVISSINSLGLLIGAFSLLIGGFGIANIMFVSVKERTPQIGIAKALGAKRRRILLEYLAEAATLSLIGGMLGIAMVWLVVLLIPSGGGINLALSFGNLVKGLIVALSIGLISGVAPAYTASRLNPVEAINSL